MNKTYSFTTLINAGLSVFLVITLIGAVTVGSGFLFDSTTFTLTVGLISLLAFSQMADGGINLLIKILTIFLMIFCLPRLIQYQYFPTLIQFPLGAMSASSINNGLLYILLGTSAMFVGVITTSKIMPAKDTQLIAEQSNSVFFGSTRVWVSVFLFELLLDVYITHGLGLSSLAIDKMHEYEGHYWVMGLRTIVGLEPILLAFFTYMFILKRVNLSKMECWIIGIVIFIYLVFMTVSGSRGGVFRLFMMVLPVALLYRKEPWITIQKLSVFIVSMVIFGILCFWIGGYFKVKTHFEHTQIYNQNKSQLQNKSDLIVSHELDQLSIDENRSVFAFFNRLGQIDYAINVINLNIAKGCKDNYINSVYTFKSIVNGLAPGNPFPEAYLNTSRLISVCYRGMTPEDLLEHGYHSEFWTGWGLALVMFGWWGGLLFMLIGGALLQIGYAVVWRFFPEKIKPYYAVLYLYIVPMLFIFTMGIDHTVNTTVFLGVQLGLALLLVKHLFWLFHKNERTVLLD